MTKALVVIDYTYDFVADDGKLTCGKPAQLIEHRIVQLVDQFVNENQYVVLAVDGHDENDPFHPETKLFPPHNLFGTKGRELFGDLQQIYEHNRHKLVWMTKTRYSAFAGTDLEIRLRARGVHEVHLVGVCTDICVLHTAVDAYNRGFTIVVHEDAVQSFNPAGHEWALQHFTQTLGAKVVKQEG